MMLMITADTDVGVAGHDDDDGDADNNDELFVFLSFIPLPPENCHANTNAFSCQRL